jgi:hypothetical protein
VKRSVSYGVRELAPALESRSLLRDFTLHEFDTCGAVESAEASFGGEKREQAPAVHIPEENAVVGQFPVNALYVE